MEINNKSALFFILFLFFFISCEPMKSTTPRANKGILDLRGYNFSSDETTTLDGEWSFYWKKLFTPPDIYKISENFYHVPGSWKTAGENSSEGYGTLSLVIYKDKTSVPLALKIPSISSSYKLWINDKPVCESGIVGEKPENSKPLWLPRVVILPDTERECIRLTLQISNFQDRRDGFWGSILIGTTESINKARDKKIAFELFIFGSILIIALYHFSLFILRREDKSIFYFALFCLLLAIRTVTSGECFLTLLTSIPSIIIYETLYIAFFLLIPVLTMYMLHLYPEEVWSKLYLIAVISAVASLIIVFLPLRIITGSAIFFEIELLLFIIYGTWCLIRAIINHREGAPVFLTGWIVLSLTGINDILFDMGVLWTGLLAPFGLLFFIFSQAFMLSKRYANAFRTIEIMSNSLLSLDIMKDEFLANTSHELKTPLNGITGLAGSLFDGARGNLPEDVKSDLLMIVTSGKRLSFLVNDILDFSKLKNKDVVLQENTVDIKSIIDSVIYLTRPLLKSSNVTLVNNIKNNLPLIKGDENRLQQIFYNLIGNAIKFTDKGNIEINAKEISIDKNKMISISVSDTGIGINKEQLDRIFEPFCQADGSISRKYGGTGIGLSITKQLVILHEGQINVESEPDRGSTFTVTLPLKKIHFPEKVTPIKGYGFYDTTDRDINQKYFNSDIINDNNASFSLNKNKQESSEKRFTVLLVDDDPVNLQVLENYLSLENYIIKKTNSGHEAINIIENDLSIDIILLDIMMPRITGYDVAKKIREKYAHFELPIIMLTAKNQISDIVFGIESGANDYLSKPFDRRELIVRVDSLLKLKESVKESKKLAVIEQDLAIAKNIQLSTMPSSIPELDSMKIAVRYIPMESIGGDFYSFHVLADNKIGILLTDVTGHGIPAALIASMLKIVSTILAEYAETPALFLTEMNRMLTGNMGDHFITAVYIFIDTKNKRLLHANAGHEPVIILKRNKRIIIEESPKGRIIGLTKDNDIELSDSEIESGDRIILFTDCIVEAYNDNKIMFGTDSFKNAIFNTIDMNTEESSDYLLNVLKEWIGKKEKFDDDFSLIIVDIK